MVLAAMIISTVVLFILLYKLPLELEKKIRIQFILSSFLIVLLGYLLMNLYVWWLALSVVAILVIFFSIIIGKQMEYIEDPQQERAVEDSIVQETQEVSPSAKDRTGDKDLPNDVANNKAEPSKPVSDESEITEDTISFSEEEDIFYDAIKKRAFIDNEEDDRTEDDENEDSLFYNLEAENELFRSQDNDARTRLLQELDDDKEGEDD